MEAPQILPVSVVPARIIPAEMSAALLHAIAESLDAAMNAPIAATSKAQRIGELAGAQYGGEQLTDLGTLHYYREPVTGTSLALWDRDLSASSLAASIKAAHVRFGVVAQ